MYIYIYIHIYLDFWISFLEFQSVSFIFVIRFFCLQKIWKKGAGSDPLETPIIRCNSLFVSFPLKVTGNERYVFQMSLSFRKRSFLSSILSFGIVSPLIVYYILVLKIL